MISTIAPQHVIASSVVIVVYSAMALTYVVRELRPGSLRLKALNRFSCPPVNERNEDPQANEVAAFASGATMAIKSTLILGEAATGTSWLSGVGQALGFRGGEEGRPKHRVVLAQSQEDQSSELETALCCFELYQGDDLSESTAAFQALCSLLGPLLERGTILVTNSLLSALVLPIPVEITNLPSAILNVEGLDVGQHLCAKFDGRSLLLLACESGNVEATVALLEFGANVLLADDRNGNTVLHTSSEQSLDCLARVLDHAQKTLTSADWKSFVYRRNHDGHTALDHACLHNKPEAVKALVNAGISLGNPAPAVVSNKGSCSNAFHKAAAHNHHECISAIGHRQSYLNAPEAGSDDDTKMKEKWEALNATDAHGNTPLIIAVKKGHVDSALALLLEGADPNCPNSSTSEYPLAISSSESNIALVQLLLVFGANPMATSASGRTPLNEANESSQEEDKKQECIGALKAFIEGLREAASVDSAMTPESNPVPDDGSVFLLAFDGGGTRGLVMAQMLIVLEQRMNKLHPNPPHISTFFDWIVGSSTGAYLALGLTLYKSTPDICRKMYFKFKTKALAGHRIYPAKDIEESLKDAFGEEAVMANIETPRVCVTTCLADRLPPELHLMYNGGEGRNGQKSPSERKVWEACRASSAAPTYFSAFEKKFLDGGVMANNPTLDAMTEIFAEGKSQSRHVKIGCILSLGTGVLPTTNMEDGAVNIVDPHGPMDLLHDAEALKDLAELFIWQCTISEGQETARARAWCECMGTPYFRFSPPIDQVELNETDNEKLIKMLFDTMVYAFERREEIDQLARLLLARKAT